MDTLGNAPGYRGAKEPYVTLRKHIGEIGRNPGINKLVNKAQPFLHKLHKKALTFSSENA